MPMAVERKIESEGTAVKEPVVVCCCTDLGYLRQSASMLASARKNLPNGHAMQIHLFVTRDVIRPIQAKFEKGFTGKNVHILWHFPDESRFRKAPIGPGGSPAAYFRMLIPEYLPEIDRAIYLDGDVIVRRSILPLWHLEFGNNILLATQEMAPDSDRIGATHGLPFFREMGLDPEAPYFNSGVLVMNLKVWRAEKLTDKALWILNTYGHQDILYGQGPLNALAFERWGSLDFEWNVTYHTERTQLMDKESAETLLEDLAIFHFTPRPRPWDLHPGARFSKCFFECLAMTGWESWTPNRRGVSRLGIRLCRWTRQVESLPYLGRLLRPLTGLLRALTFLLDDIGLGDSKP